MDEQLEARYKEALRAAKEKLLALQEELKRQRDEAPTRPLSREPIAIIGLACRFPGGADNPEAFRRLLLSGYDASADIPSNRWDVDRWYHPRRGEAGKTYCKRAALLSDEPGLFDPAFFQISPAEAEAMDPQQRLLLEVSWHALEDAGLDPLALRGSATGVFAGVSTIDYLGAHMSFGRESGIDPYSTTGAMACSSSGRLNYFYDFHGPSVALDTACSSSLAAIHEAVASLRLGGCGLALAGGVNLILSPMAHIGLSAMNAISPDGRCKAFSQEADGFGRGEGCGLAVLKRLSDAVRDGDRIHAVILGTAVGHGGRANGFTAPTAPSQMEIIKNALADAGLSPHEVGYIEAHGTGTPLGDPIEVDALGAVFRGRKTPLLLGAVKSNIGHLEAAAGIAGVTKAIFCVRDGVIPSSIHCDHPSEKIEWASQPISLVRKTTDWQAGEVRRIAGISSFGFSGTGAHVIIAEYKPAIAAAESGNAEPNYPAPLLLLSAQSQEALRACASSLREWLAQPQNDFASACLTSALRRAHLPHRLAVAAPDAEAAIHKLEDWLAAPVAEAARPKSGAQPVFLFSGQGSQTPGMGRELCLSFPAFRAVIDRCDAVSRDKAGFSIKDEMFAAAEQSKLAQTKYTQPAIFAYQMALFELWSKLGVKPACLIGHSIGEYAAACAAGVFSIEAGMELVLKRAELVEQFAAEGMMAALAVGTEAARELIGNDPGLSIAAENAPAQAVIAGGRQQVEAVMAKCKEKGISCRELKVSRAFHSPTLDPVLPHYKSYLQSLSFAQPRLPIISTHTGKRLEANLDWREYFVKQMRGTVLFAQALEQAKQAGQRLFLELGSFPVLTGLARHTLKEGAALIASAKPNENQLMQFAQAAGDLHREGVDIKWAGYYGASRFKPASLPAYPFQRNKYYISPVPEQAVQAQPTSHASQPATAPAPSAMAELSEQDQARALIDMQLKAMQDLLQMQISALR